MSSYDTQLSSDKRSGRIYFISPFWWVIYIGMSIIVSLILLILITFPLGLSVASDVVFGALACASGIVADLVLKKQFKLHMMISEKIPYSVLYLWVPFCLSIMILKPFA